MKLKNMLTTGDFKNILELKVFLINHKKSGHLFYFPEMACLEENEEFDLFFYLSKPSKTQKEAFPIPRNAFDDNISEERLQALYTSYYCTDCLPEPVFFHNLEVYEGSDWVWLYENCVSEGI